MFNFSLMLLGFRVSQELAHVSSILVLSAIILFVAETLWYKHLLSNEAARKFIHISLGVFIAFWPFWINFRDIRLISLALLIGIAISWRFQLFRSIHKVERSTVGELLYPISIGLIASLTQSKWIFVAAVLHLSIADGLAAVIGQRYGRKNRYRIWGSTKSIAGSLALGAASLLITGWIILISPEQFNHVGYLVIGLLPLSVILMENLSPFGTDNIFVPLLVVLILNAARVH